MLENRIKEHDPSTTSVIFLHSSAHNHPKTDISLFKSIHQDRKQVSREGREAIHIRRNNPALNHNICKMTIPKIFNQILGTNNTTSTDSLQTLISHKSLLQLPVVGPLWQLTYITNSTSPTIITSEHILGNGTPPLQLHPLHIYIQIYLFSLKPFS